MVGKIILASSSPRRADILKRTKIEFEIMPSPYVEEHTTTAFSYEFIENLAYNKIEEKEGKLSNENHAERQKRWDRLIELAGKIW